jgi:uncharacterized protein YqgC (DUF456 family)
VNIAAFVVALVLIVLGLAGTILPMLPGIPLIYCAYLVYGLLTSWHSYGAWTMLIWGVVTAATLVLDYYAPMLGARRSNSSILGMWGSFVGSVIGLILFGLPGLIVGTFAGAFVGELMARRPPSQALRAGGGALIGFLGGSLVKLVIGLIMAGTFLWQVLAA